MPFPVSSIQAKLCPPEELRIGSLSGPPPSLDAWGIQMICGQGPQGSRVRNGTRGGMLGARSRKRTFHLFPTIPRSSHQQHPLLRGIPGPFLPGSLALPSCGLTRHPCSQSQHSSGAESKSPCLINSLKKKKDNTLGQKDNASSHASPQGSNMKKKQTSKLSHFHAAQFWAGADLCEELGLPAELMLMR